MSAWVSAAPVIGTGSLDGFAIGALMSGACALAITGPRRARRPSRDGVQAAERTGWLCEHVMAAEAAEFGLAAEATVTVAAAEVAGGGLAAEAARAGLAGVPAGARLAIGSGGSAEALSAIPMAVIIRGEAAIEAAGGPSAVEAVRAEAPGAVRAACMAEAGLAGEAFTAWAERSARPEELGAPGKARSAGGLDGKAADGYRSRHRRGDPIPARAPSDSASPQCVSQQGVFQQGVFPNGACPDFGRSGRRSRRDTDPDVVFPAADIGLVTLAGPRRPEARRMPPRHAAPAVSLGSRISGIGSRMTGLFATRAVAGSARG